MNRAALLVLVTVPTPDAGAALGRTLVEERLAACANLVPGLRSIYRWQDAVHDDAEVLMLIKTTDDLLDRLTQRVVELHSYDVPEVLALPLAGGSAPYLDWLVAQVEPQVQP